MRNLSSMSRYPRVGRSRLRHGTAVLSAAALAATALAGCGSSSGGSSSDGASQATPSGVRTAKAHVAKLSKKLSGYPLPTAKLDDVAKLRGKTVYYVPITRQAAQFSTTGTALKAALKKVGATLDICDGNSNPTQISSCLDQARHAKAAGVITDSIPYQMASNSFGKLRSAKIPVLITDQIADPARPADSTLGYLPGAGGAMLKAVADWIIADSGGKAKVVINESTDSPSTKSYVTDAESEFTKLCPDCTVTLNKISSANFSMIASSTSSTILRNPDTRYVISEFDQYLQPTQKGVQQSGRSASIKGASTAAQIAGLQKVKAKSFLSVDAGQASAYQGWVSADAIMRMILGQKLPTYSIPLRLFTASNIGSITISEKAQKSGEWFGPTDYPSKFAALWGAK